MPIKLYIVDKNIANRYCDRKEKRMKHVLMRLQEYEKQASATEKNVILYFWKRRRKQGS